jgi:uncharacterized protein (DUF924 family)
MKSHRKNMVEKLNEAAFVLRWWFAPEIKPHWFERSDAFDVEVRSRLGPLHGRAMAGEIDDWAGDPKGLLALVILFDQVPRNIHRGTPLAFATDAKALALARLAVDRGLDAGFETDERLFLYLPFEHSEQLADQERSVALFRALGDANYLDYAIRHRDVIARFGRFPHRNAVLGRPSTAAERAFLEEPGSAF